MRIANGRMLLGALVVVAASSSGAVGLAQTAGSPPDPGPAPATSMQGALLANPESREQVMSLQDDPLVRSILSDPATMRAVQSGDLGALMADPKIQALSDNPTVRGLVEQQTR
jgi:hypothetical protein